MKRYSNYSHAISSAESCIISHGSVQVWGVSTGISTTEHEGTAKCTRVHLAREVETFQRRLVELAKITPARDFAWFQAAIADAFSRALEGEASLDGEEG